MFVFLNPYIKGRNRDGIPVKSKSRWIPRYDTNCCMPLPSRGVRKVLIPKRCPRLTSDRSSGHRRALSRVKKNRRRSGDLAHGFQISKSKRWRYKKLTVKMTDRTNLNNQMPWFGLFLTAIGCIFSVKRRTPTNSVSPSIWPFFLLSGDFEFMGIQPLLTRIVKLRTWCKKSDSPR